MNRARRAAGLGAAAIVSVVVLVFAGLGASSTGTYASAVMADNPSAYWHFDEQPGTTNAADASGNSYGLIYSGATLGVDDGLDDGGANTAISSSGSRAAYAYSWPRPTSIEFWFASSQQSPSNGESLVSAGNYWNEHWQVGVDGQGNVYASSFALNGVVEEGQAPGTQTQVSGGFVDDGAWHHVVVDFNGAQSAIYTDGESDTISATSQPWNPLAAPACNPTCQPDTIDFATFPGSLDEVAIYDHLLGAGGAVRHYSAGTSANVHLVPMFPPTGTDFSLHPNFGGRQLDSAWRQTLRGVRSSIEAPDPSDDAQIFKAADGTVAAMRVSAEKFVKSNGAAGLAQIGFARTSRGTAVGDCGEFPVLTNYTEFKPLSTSLQGYQCFVVNLIGPNQTNSRYSAMNNAGTTSWTTFLNGEPARSTDVGFEKASYVLAGAEINGNVPWISKFAQVWGCYGCGTTTTPWQYTSDAWTGIEEQTWKTIGKSKFRDSGDANWTIGRTPGPFIIRHPFDFPLSH